MSLSPFAEQEAGKFREDFVQLLERDVQVGAEKASRIADICARVFREYLGTYKGSFSPEPFAKMRTELDSAGFSDSAKIVLAAIGWTRGNLYTDWKRQAKKGP
eukprot:SM000048S16526  [mRNA]  locus=s48:241120:242126:+ [translate_table: standard]